MIPDTIIMRNRFAGQCLIDELLKRQSVTARRTLIERAFGQPPLDADSSAWYSATQGEIQVGRVLAGLPPAWIVFHALPLGAKGDDIDHLVIGPGGIFTISTRNHRGETVWVGARSVVVAGKEKPYIPGAEFEADLITGLLRARMPLIAPARPIVALVNAKSIVVREIPRQVWIVAAGALCQRLLDLPPVLSSSEVDELAAYVDRPTMWSSRVSETPPDAMARYLAIDREVRVAKARRAAWLLLAPVATLGAVVAAVVTASEVVPL